MHKGYLHIYCGEGKGKTSILNGMAIRACGVDMKVVYLRFLKNRPSAENKIIEEKCCKIERFYSSSTKFVWEMNEEEVIEFKRETLLGFDRIKECLQDTSIDLILIDELLGAVENKFIDKNELIEALKSRITDAEIAISGRYSFDELDEIADLISVITPKKHYFDDKIVARKGIEF